MSSSSSELVHDGELTLDAPALALLAAALERNAERLEAVATTSAAVVTSSLDVAAEDLRERVKRLQEIKEQHEHAETKHAARLAEMETKARLQVKAMKKEMEVRMEEMNVELTMKNKELANRLRVKENEHATKLKSQLDEHARALQSREDKLQALADSEAQVQKRVDEIVAVARSDPAAAVELLVGGKTFVTSAKCMAKFPRSILSTLWKRHLDDSASDAPLRIPDGDPTHFQLILNYLRNPDQLPVLASAAERRWLAREAEEYGLSELVKMCHDAEKRVYDIATVMELLNGAKNLSGLDLRGLDLSRIDFSEASMMHARLDNTRLCQASFYKADMRYVNLSNADATGANFACASLGKANMCNANASLAIFREARMYNTNIAGADLRGAELACVAIKDLKNLAKAKIDNLMGANLAYADLSGVDFEDVDIGGADMVEADFRNARNIRNAKVNGKSVRATPSYWTGRNTKQIMSVAALDDVRTPLALALADSKLEVTATFALSAYNDLVEPHLRLPSPSPAQHSDSLCALVGSSKNMWPAFIAHLAEHPAQIDAPNPLDAWVETVVTRAARDVEKQSEGALSDGSSHVYFAHHTEPGKLVAMQRLAKLTGAYFLDDIAHLAIHPTHGQWCALRAVVIFATSPASNAPSVQMERNPLSERASAPDVVRRLFDDAVAGVKDGWLTLRESLCPSHESRYSPEQIAYHYHGDKEVLRACVVKSARG
ncbi:hypothetical protein PPROV_000584000 [Pycnococcus provasolii]|uniref:Potassium channel tetramerisation-type BTB domain-containing protein n=2 Tax=Pycnococcus provasolii TaxID=41880 RepID=A0A830HQ23_9CHLO|nr:hypothetical protein PPROV_000584000 [Pycnococcus provasolii]